MHMFCNVELGLKLIF